MRETSSRKPHNGNAGYICERRSNHPKLPGHFVIYDRDADPSPGIDSDDRWIVVHEPSGHHVGLATLSGARELMESMAAGGNDADFGQSVNDPRDETSAITVVAMEVAAEVRRAMTKHGPMNSGHEAYSVILEELDEFWEEVKRQALDKAATRKELIQVAAMACRAIHDLKL
jgi:hypothetical protein